MKPIVYREHQAFPDGCGQTKEQVKRALASRGVTLKVVKEYMGKPECLGLDGELTASYYIGADWLIENQLPVVVLPKLEKLDFAAMLLTALSQEDEADYFSKCYGVDFSKPVIETTATASYLTSILLVHYISLLEKICRTGLKKDYLTVYENLEGKVKGHIIIEKQLQKNIVMGRSDRAYCRFLTYTADIPVNRLLKKALLFANYMLHCWTLPQGTRKNMQVRLNRLLNVFESVSDTVNFAEVNRVPQNKLFRHYPEAVRVAKTILQRYDYSISRIETESHSTPVFWIDMSRLYEMYVLSRLRVAYPRQIRFQVEGYGGCKADYLHLGEQLIIDAKYKPQYSDSYAVLDDIREISGYARDRKILRELDVPEDGTEVKCLIIYPSEDSENVLLTSEEDKHSGKKLSLWERASEIKHYRNFRKLVVLLPTK